MAAPDVMYDGEQWWEPCPFRGFWPHARKKWRLENLEGHAYGDDGRCWLPARPEAFRPWRGSGPLPSDGDRHLLRVP